MMLEFWSALTTYELSWLDCLLVLSVMLVAGISKAGIKGISIIVVIVMAFVFVGDGLRDAADPYSEARK